MAFLVWLIILPPSLALLYFTAEVLLGLRKIAPSNPGQAEPQIAVVIPAHNETAMIASTVAAARDQIPAGARVLVVADNCSDDTADRARGAGAEVTERINPLQRGKGFALAHARDFLAHAPPDAVFVLDADCRISDGSLAALAQDAVARGEPVQARNLLTATRGASPLVQLSNFAMLIKNVVRARGLYRLAGGITLFGTGMIFPWRVFERLDLATSEAVEDLSLALLLARQGTRVHFSETLQVTSPAADVSDSLGQRRRWEHGFLANSLKYGMPSFLRGMVRGSRHLLGLGAHLMVPPLALLFLVAACALVPAIGLAVAGGGGRPLLVLTYAMVCGSLATGLAWYREGRSTITLSALARAPLYVFWKIPLYLGFVFSRQTRWNRTRRLNERN